MIISGENCIIFFWPNHFRFGVLPQTQDCQGWSMLIGQSLYSLWTKSMISHQIFDNSRIFHSWFFQPKTVGHSFAWTREAFSHESESKAYYLDDEEFLLPSCIHLMKPPHLIFPPKKTRNIKTKRWQVFFVEGSTARNGSFFVFWKQQKGLHVECQFVMPSNSMDCSTGALKPYQTWGQTVREARKIWLFCKRRWSWLLFIAVFAEVG